MWNKIPQDSNVTRSKIIHEWIGFVSTCQIDVEFFMKLIFQIKRRFLMAFLVFVGSQTINGPSFAQNAEGSLKYGDGATGISVAKPGWESVSSDVQACVNLAYSSRNATIVGLTRLGIGPADPRVASVVNFCRSTLATRFKENIRCNVLGGDGHFEESVCNESFAQEINGSVRPIGRDDFIRGWIARVKVFVSEFETTSGHDARLLHEKEQAETNRIEADRLAEIERQKFASSPKGKAAALAEKHKKDELKNFRPY
jgi:hypothetical protein